MSPQLSSCESVVRGNSERVGEHYLTNILVSFEHLSIFFVLETGWCLFKQKVPSNNYPLSLADGIKPALLGFNISLS